MDDDLALCLHLTNNLYHGPASRAKAVWNILMRRTVFLLLGFFFGKDVI